METLQMCPVCGREVDNGLLQELGLPGEVLEEVRTLREQGKLTQAILVAVKIVRTVQDNPQWMKDLLDEQTRDLSNEFSRQFNHGKTEILKALYELIGNPVRGRIQEASIAQRLKAASPRDNFDTENSTRHGEDVKCTVKDGVTQVGKILLESKKVNKWNNAFIDQLQDYMKTENTPFGIIATTAMPSDALSYSNVIDGILVVNVDYIETAYLFMREYLIAKIKLEAEYNTKTAQLQVEERVMTELRTAVNSGELDILIGLLRAEMEVIDKLVNDCSGYMDRFYGRVKRETGEVRELVTKLMSNHIDVMRSKLANN